MPPVSGRRGVHGGVIAFDIDLNHEKLPMALQIPLSNFEVREEREEDMYMYQLCTCAY